VVQADSNFFDIFPYRLLAGDATTALKAPKSIVISKDLAIKFFGREQFEQGKILGNELLLTIYGWNAPCKITGISENTPANTHMHYDIILSNSTDPWSLSNVWVDNTYYTYIKLKPDVDIKTVESKISLVVKTLLEPQLATTFSTNYAQMKAKGNYWNYKLQPLTQIHLYSHFDREIEHNGNIRHIHILGLSAVFILLIVCINYTNLSTANSIERSKEVGIKKALGSSSGYLRIQFFIESMILSFLATILSLVIIHILQVPFARLMQVSLPANFLGNSFTWWLVVAIFIGVSFLGGVYPALHISSFHLIDSIKGKVWLGSRFFNFRRTLITIQFSISFGLLFSVIVVYRQLNFFLDKTSGFDKENVLVLADPSQKLGSLAETIKENLLQQSSVVNASICSDYPGSGGYLLPFSARKRYETTEHVITSFTAGFDFLKTFNIPLLQGRDFSKELDEKAPKRLIINEAARRLLDLPQPLGEHIVTRDLNGLDPTARTEFEIIGVVKNFNFESLHSSIKPIAISLENTGTFIAVRVQPGSLHKTVETIKKVWTKVAPNIPFEYSFVDDEVKHLYKTEQVLSQLLSILTILILMITSLGLLGLIILIFQQRSKEVGIRKVLGASSLDIIMFLSKDFFKMMGIAFCITSPFAWWAMHQWLQEFAYRIDISWWLFFVAALVVFFITVVTIFFKAARAAVINPVEMIRTE
jgi:putative ABC transport system permease protein